MYHFLYIFLLNQIFRNAPLFRSPFTYRDEDYQVSSCRLILLLGFYAISLKPLAKWGLKVLPRGGAGILGSRHARAPPLLGVVTPGDEI